MCWKFKWHFPHYPIGNFYWVVTWNVFYMPVAVSNVTFGTWCTRKKSHWKWRGVLARGRVTSTSYELTRIRYNWWELGTKMANFVLSCQIVLIPYLIPRFSHNHQEIFTIVPYSTLIPEAIFHQEGYCRNCTVFHLVFPRLTHIFLYIFIVKYIHNILSLIPY